MEINKVYITFKMSSENIDLCLTKADIVKHLHTIDINPSKENFELFKTMFFEHLCSKLSISEVPDQIKKFDIYKIKKFYLENDHQIDRMINNHPHFFNSPIKLKRVAPVSATASVPSSSTVVVFKKS